MSDCAVGVGTRFRAIGVSTVPCKLIGSPIGPFSRAIGFGATPAPACFVCAGIASCDPAIR
jgi:hypothetical protein